MKNRYNRNMMAISPEENEKLKDFRICVVGCGGLGGYIIEMLGRLGIGCITAIDGDVFDETNLNRQLLSKESWIGKEKALAAKERMAEVNSEVKINAIVGFLDEKNAGDIISKHHLVIDALDNMSARHILEEECERQGITMIHGAIGGWYGQVTVIRPGDRTLETIYPRGENKGVEAELGNPAYTPAIVAAIEVSEAVKVLLKKGEPLYGSLLTIDLLTQEYEKFEI